MGGVVIIRSVQNHSILICDHLSQEADPKVDSAILSSHF